MFLFKNTEEKVTNGVTQDSSRSKGAENGQESSTFSKPSGEGHIVIGIDDVQDNEPIQEPSYVEAYMKVMYWMCVSPFNPSKNLGKNTTSWTDWALNVSQKVRNYLFIMNVSKNMWLHIS